MKNYFIGRLHRFLAILKIFIGFVFTKLGELSVQKVNEDNKPQEDNNYQMKNSLGIFLFYHFQSK